MTLKEKLASKTEEEKLRACDSSIESCLKILEQELEKRRRLSKTRLNKDIASRMDNKLMEIQNLFKLRVDETDL